MLVASLDADPLSRKETLDLIRSYYSIPDRILARKLFDLIKTLASPVEDEDLEKETNE